MADKEFAKLGVCAADEKNSRKRKGASTRLSRHKE